MYIGVSPNKFDELVKSGRMPSPKRIDGRKVWDMRALIRFTAIMGPLSSLFDLLTFGGLIFIFHASPTEFRTT